MLGRAVLAGLRAGFAAIGLVGLIGLVVHNVRRDAGFSYLNFFSFFTVESNLLAVVSLGLGAASALAMSTHRAPARDLTWFRGLAAFAMAATGIVYNVLLQEQQDALQSNLPWANFVVHVVMPLVVVVDFLADRTLRPIRWEAGLGWLAFPVLYTAYSLLRGPIADFYPYPFLDPRLDGYAAVARTGGVIGIGFVLLACLLVWSSRWARERRAL